MNASEYKIFYEQSVREYAEDNVRAGYWTEAEALESSAKEFERLLPQGLESDGHHLFVLEEDGKAIGFIWLRVRQTGGENTGFIFQVRIDEEFRGKGHGKRMMLLLEEKAREMGISKIGLHVFGFNEVAKHLYLSLGYEISSVNMTKKIIP